MELFFLRRRDSAELFQFRPNFRLLAKQQDFFDLGEVG
jgi:hypothetical protein